MKKGKNVLILAVLLVILLGGAGFAYSALREHTAPETVSAMPEAEQTPTESRTPEESQLRTLQYIFRPVNSLWGFQVDKDCVFTELILLNTSEIDETLCREKKGFFAGYISFKQHDSYVKRFVDDIHLKADIVSLDFNASIVMKEKGAVLITCLEGTGEILHDGKQMAFGKLDSFEVPSDEPLTINAKERMKLLRIMYL